MSNKRVNIDIKLSKSFTALLVHVMFINECVTKIKKENNGQWAI